MIYLASRTSEFQSRERYDLRLLRRSRRLAFNFYVRIRQLPKDYS